MAWRKTIDNNLRPYLERFIAETHRYKTNFDLADDKGKAQLWIAIAMLSKQLYNIEIKLNYLERALKEISGYKETATFLKEVEKFKPIKEEREQEIPRINLGTIEDKEATALGDGAKLLSEISRDIKKKKLIRKKAKKK